MSIKLNNWGGIIMRTKTKITAIMLLVVLFAMAAFAFGSETNKLLAQARASTAKYNNVNNAIADGYFSTVECVESPFGTMGIHFVNPDLMDCAVDETQPEILLYVPTEKGARLVGAAAL